MALLFTLRRAKRRLHQPERFLSRAAGLMDEGYTFHDSVRMLLPHHLDDPDGAEQVLEQNLRSGEGPDEILENIGFSPALLIPVGIAVSHGNLPEAIRTVSDRLKRRGKTLEKLRKATLYPAVLFGFIALLFVLFRTLFMPNMEKMLAGRGGEGEAMALSAFLLRIPDFLMGAAGVMSAGAVIAYLAWTRQSAEVKLRAVHSVPVLSRWIRMGHTSVFAREMGTLLGGGIPLQQAISILAEQDERSMLAFMTRTTGQRILMGDPLHEAVRHAGGFMPDFPSFIRHGEEGGHLPREMLVYSELIDEKIGEESEKLIAVIQPVLFGILAVCIMGAYLALMLPVYSMVELQ
ncbi:competence type IV pilus assembly protein ComGB [Bhargavaea massiliensis]|uniref:competence type IV pilus assembly protein ComGB n=1 Tax=Bhargavaea massiliensis TaxID=2697500 RepID=UPI001BCB0233|nr:competence type IV pilus assembly protein ComGB [Bhargavaea massiliensis]